MKPGLYVATVHGEPGAVVYGPMGNGQMVRLGAPWRSDGRVQYLASGSIADARPLVVLDPESKDDWRRVHEALEAHLKMRDALYALADPKPAEPTGLGAVVLDSAGRHWVRANSWNLPWVYQAGANGAGRKWSDLDVVEVLSEGWSE